ncbi:MAG TPA: membrane protein insertion efficiency factor YidD [Deltaproteobacteria bacterium]|nr:membrane protein insertion efficiency factor YidD [Deltaproteobacteria bacterium]
MRPGDILIGAIRFYQKAVSPYLGNNCRYTPSCSEYTIRSISTNGCVIGVLAGVRRILRCHPFHPGGVDEPRPIHFFGTRD